MDELIGIYKGLRLPLLGMVLIFLTWYVFRPSRKNELEQPKYDMLEDDIDQPVSGPGSADQEKTA